MTEQFPNMNDFIAETKGHCFLCSNKSYRQPPTSSSLEFFGLSSVTSSTHSLHCLSRYLGLDMTKAFTGSGPLPPDLVTRLKKSKLRAELCEECACLTKTFSGLVRRLERVEMEVASCLNKIHGKLATTVNSDKHYNLRATNLEDECTAKLEITEALRQDAVQKCSSKLSTDRRPLAKLQRLTWKQVNLERVRVKLNYKKTESSSRTSIQYFEVESNHEVDDIGSPVSAPISNEDGMDYLAEQNHSISSPLLNEENHDIGFGTETIKEEVIEESQHPYFNAGQAAAGQSHDQIPSTNTNNAEIKTIKRCNAAENKVSDLSQAIPPPIKVTGNVGIGKPEISRDQKTGKYKCRICSREFGSVSGFRHHYDTVHLKVRHKCGLCEKEFPQKPTYERHYLSIHLGVRFKCGECHKTFADKDNLIQHQKGAHLGQQFKCKYCERQFSQVSSRNTHMKNSCTNRRNLLGTTV